MMLAMLLVLEILFMCFVLVMVCLVGIANGPVGLVTFYERDVQERVVELGYTTKERIRRSTAVVGVALLAPTLVMMPLMVRFVNGAADFVSCFWQLAVIYLAMGAFDRLFIDTWWVGHTKAWIIEGTEDLMPYIPGRAMLKKWIGTVVLYPVFAALMAWVVTLIG